MRRRHYACFLIAGLPLVVACSGSDGAQPAAGSGGGGSTAAQGGSGGQGPTGAGGQGGTATSTGEGAGGAASQGGAGGETESGPPPPTDEDAGGYEVQDDWIFSEQTIHKIEITLPPSSVDGLNADGFTFVPGDFAFDGIQVPNVGVRLRGKIGSFRTLSGKPKFKIEFNQFVPDQRFYGLDAMTLNNEVVDCSFLKEPLAYRVFAIAGLPPIRVGYTRVFVNGADYGFYILIETTDSRWLKRNYAMPKGNFYDGKYVWYGGWNYTLLDFASGVDDQFQLEEGTDVGHADITAVSDAVSTWWGSGQFTPGLDPLLNWDEYHRELAAEQWLGHNDGYAMNQNNYRVYFDPADGRASIVPWDLDYGFLHDYDWGMNWSQPRGRLALGCFQDASCVATHKAAVQVLIGAIDPQALLGWFNQIDALTYADAHDDPRRECGADQIAPWRDGLRAWIQNKNAELASFWGLQ